MTRKILFIFAISTIIGAHKNIWSMDDEESWGIGSTVNYVGHVVMKRCDSTYRINNAIQNSTFEFNQKVCIDATERYAIDICNDITLIDTKAFPLVRRLSDACEEILLAAKRHDFSTITKIHEKTKGMKPQAFELLCDNLCNHADQSVVKKLENMRKTAKPATSFVQPDQRTDTLEDYQKKERELSDSANYINKFTVAANQLVDYMNRSKNHLENLRHEAGTSQKRILAETDSQLEELMATAASLRATIAIETLPQIGRSEIFLPPGDTDSIYSAGDEHWPSVAPSTYQVYNVTTPDSSPRLTAENLRKYSRQRSIDAPSMAGKVPPAPRTIPVTALQRRAFATHDLFSSSKSDKTAKSAPQTIEVDEETLEEFQAFIKQKQNSTDDVEDESGKELQAQNKDDDN